MDRTKPGWKVVENFLNAKEKRNDWAKNVSDDMKFNTPGFMWTSEQVAVLQARGQAPIEVPIITPQIELQKSLILSKAPQYKIIGRTDDDVKRAKLMGEICYYIWYKNNTDLLTDQIVGWQLEASKGYFYTFWEPNGDNGYGLVSYSALHPLDVVVDPDSRDLDEEDADYKYIYNMISLDSAIRKYPNKKDKIMSLPDDVEEVKFENSDYENMEDIHLFDQLFDENKKHFLEITEQKKFLEKIFVLKYNDGVNDVEREVTEDEYKILKQNLKEPTEQNVAITNSIKEIDVFYRTRVKETVVYGYEVMEERILPTEHYTIVPVPFHHRGNPYPVSLTRRMKGMQLEVNHRRSLMIAHATASLSSTILVPSGSIPNLDEFEENKARPNSVLEYHPDLTLKNAGIIQLQPQQLPNEYYALEDRAKHDAQFVAGSFGLSHGDTTNTPETFRATVMLDENAGRRIGLASKNLYYALNKLGRITVDFIQHYMRKDRILRIVNPYDPYDQKIMSVGIGKTIGDKYDPNEIELLGDPSVGQYDVQVIIGSMAPNNRYAELDIYKQYYEAGIIDDIEVLKKTDIFDREGVIKRKSALAQSQEAIKQLNEQIKAISKELEETRDQLETAKLSVTQYQEKIKQAGIEQRLREEYQNKLLELEAAMEEVKLLKQGIKLKNNNRSTLERTTK